MSGRRQLRGAPTRYLADEKAFGAPGQPTYCVDAGVDLEDLHKVALQHAHARSLYRHLQLHPPSGKPYLQAGSIGLRPACDATGYSYAARAWLHGKRWMNLMDEARLHNCFPIRNDDAQYNSAIREADRQFHRARDRRLVPLGAGPVLPSTTVSFPPSAPRAERPNALGRPFLLGPADGFGTTPPPMTKTLLQDLSTVAETRPLSMQVSNALWPYWNEAARALALQPALATLLGLYRELDLPRNPERALIVMLTIWIAPPLEPVATEVIESDPEQSSEPRLRALYSNNRRAPEPDVWGSFSADVIDVELVLAKNWLVECQPMGDRFVLAVHDHAFDGRNWVAGSETVVGLAPDLSGDLNPAAVRVRRRHTPAEPGQGASSSPGARSAN